MTPAFACPCHPPVFPSQPTTTVAGEPRPKDPASPAAAPSRHAAIVTAHNARHRDRYLARRAVVGRVRNGTMPAAATLACADCGSAAKHYDHFMGYEPAHRLDVQPVCVPCHWKREIARRPDCKRGHSLSGENLRVRADGVRICRTCAADQKRTKRHPAPPATATPWMDDRSAANSLRAAADNLRQVREMLDPDEPHRNAAVQVGGGRVVGPSGYDLEEQDRERAARAFVNFSTDQLLRMSLGNLCRPKVCVVCGISFLATNEKDVLCHVDVGQAMAEAHEPSPEQLDYEYDRQKYEDMQDQR